MSMASLSRSTDIMCGGTHHIPLCLSDMFLPDWPILVMLCIALFVVIIIAIFNCTAIAFLSKNVI